MSWTERIGDFLREAGRGVDRAEYQDRLRELLERVEMELEASRDDDRREAFEPAK